MRACRPWSRSATAEPRAHGPDVRTHPDRVAVSRSREGSCRECRCAAAGQHDAKRSTRRPAPTSPAPPPPRPPRSRRAAAAARRPDRRGVLRRRQHDDAGRLDLLLGPRPGRPQVLHHRDMLRLRLAAAKFRVLAGREQRRRRPGRARRRWRSSPAGRSTRSCRLSEEIFDELMADRIWSGTHALARLHLDAGQRVWLVTAAPVELGAVIAQPARPDRRDRHGGRDPRRHLHRPAGRRADARPGQGGGGTELAEREGLDLARCTAYSDSVNDLPMLSLVGPAVAVNPDSALRPGRPRAGLGDPRLPDRPQGRQDRRPGGAGAGVVAGGRSPARSRSTGAGAFRAMRRGCAARGSPVPTARARLTISWSPGSRELS